MRRCIVYGFEAISTHNGWAMALTGALIVFSGLVVLSTVISQLHKVLNLLEGGMTRLTGGRNLNGPQTTSVQIKKEAQKEPDTKPIFPDNIEEIIEEYKVASASLGDSFDLADLYRIAGEMDAPHPYLTISYLRQHQHLKPFGDGMFSWG